MGRFFGRRPDPTPEVQRALAKGFLESGEQVLAGVYVQRPGTNAAAFETAADASVSASTGIHGISSTNGDGEWTAWAAAAENLHGIDPSVAERTVKVLLALTGSRVLLVRGGRMVGRRPHEVLASWSLAQVDRIEVPRGGGSLRIVRDGATLEFELPLAHKFLDDVYRELPARFEQAKRAAGAAPGT